LKALGVGGTRRVAIGRELTKIYEEVLIGTPKEILGIFSQFPEKKKGEFVVMIV
jgi:16S rRNA C1402 (ribose-2'-O) methylase RsmI